jgi:hypothetical protein
MALASDGARPDTVISLRRGVQRQIVARWIGVPVSWIVLMAAPV